MVIDEVAHGELATTIISSLIDTGRVLVLEPSIQSVREAKHLADRTGDSHHISETDLSVVALGLDLKGQSSDVTIVSDDYAVANLASVLKIRVAPVMSKGIDKVVHWVVYCRGCGKVFHDTNIVECDICGTKLSRKFGKTSLRASFKS